MEKIIGYFMRRRKAKKKEIKENLEISENGANPRR